MNVEKHHGGWVILLSFIFSFMLAIIPLPIWATVWRPDWVEMVLIYWCLAIPQRIGIITAFHIGIIYDVLHNSLLGQHALFFSFIAYVSIKLHRQIRLFPLWQQAIVIFGLITITHLFNIIINSILGHPPLVLVSFIYEGLSSMLLWPWLFIILRDMRRTYNVY
jgi:rod shape-determining protein MreD